MYVVQSTITGVYLSPLRETAERAEQDRRMLARPEVAEVVRVPSPRVEPCSGRAA